MNKISKIGFSMCLIAFILMIILIIIGQKIPEFLIYIFWIGLAVTFAGAIVKQRDQ